MMIVACLFISWAVAFALGYFVRLCSDKIEKVEGKK